MVRSLARVYAVLLCAIAAALCMPLTQHHWFNSHEGYTYVIRVAEYADAIRGGDFYPRWAPDFYLGYGSPYFVFYAPLVFAAGAVIDLVVGSATVGLKLLVLLATMGAGLGMFRMVREETQRSDAALLASLVYLAAPYRLTNVYVRGDLAEYAALSLLPWAIYAYRALCREPDVVRSRRFALLAVVCHAALVLTHTISGLWGSAILLVVIAGSTIGLWRRRAVRQIATLWVAFALVFVVSSFYTVPALLEKRYVSTEAMVMGWFDPTSQYLPRASFLEHGGRFFLLPLLVGASVLALAALVRNPRHVKPALWAAGALLFALLSSRYAIPFWGLRLPLITYTQFPWRLHGQADTLASIAIGLGWAGAVRRGSWADAAAMAIGAAAVLDAIPVVGYRDGLNADAVAESPSAIRARMHTATSGDDYIPKVVVRLPDRPAAAVAASTEDVTVTSAVSVRADHWIQVQVARPAEIVLALHQFPGWRVTTLSGPASAAIGTSSAGLVAVRFLTPGEYAIRVAFGPTPVRLVSGLLSLLGVLAVWPALRAASRARISLPRLRYPSPPRFAAFHSPGDSS